MLALAAGVVSNAEVARALFLSPVPSTHWHTVRIYQKIGASRRCRVFGIRTSSLPL